MMELRTATGRAWRIGLAAAASVALVLGASGCGRGGSSRASSSSDCIGAAQHTVTVQNAAFERSHSHGSSHSSSHSSSHHSSGGGLFGHSSSHHSTGHHSSGGSHLRHHVSSSHCRHHRHSSNAGVSTRSCTYSRLSVTMLEDTLHRPKATSKRPYATLKIVNPSQGTCRLSGTPKVTMVDAAGKTLPIPASQNQGTLQRMPRHSSTTFALDFLPGRAGATAFKPVKLEVKLPSATASTKTVTWHYGAVSTVTGPAGAAVEPIGFNPATAPTPSS